MKKRVRVGCAGWSIPAEAAAAFPRDGSHLERYAARFDCVEINSTFYRPHLAATYERWAASVPAHFRFSVKMPRSITHDARLVGAGPLARKFLAEASHLGSKLGCVLVQLPPSLAFDRAVAKRFLQMMRRHYDGSLALAPRELVWCASRRIAGRADDLPGPGRSCDCRRRTRAARPRLFPLSRLAADVLFELLERTAPGSRASDRDTPGRGLVHLRQHGARRGDTERARVTRADRFDRCLRRITTARGVTRVGAIVEHTERRPTRTLSRQNRACCRARQPRSSARAALRR